MDKTEWKEQLLKKALKRSIDSGLAEEWGNAFLNKQDGNKIISTFARGFFEEMVGKINGKNR